MKKTALQNSLFSLEILDVHIPDKASRNSYKTKRKFELNETHCNHQQASRGESS